MLHLDEDQVGVAVVRDPVRRPDGDVDRLSPGPNSSTARQAVTGPCRTPRTSARPAGRGAGSSAACPGGPRCRLTLWSEASSLEHRVVAPRPLRELPPRRSPDLPGPCAEIQPRAPHAARSAARTALRNSMARVIGPTPADPRRDPPGHLGHVLVDVGEQLPALPAGPGARPPPPRA